MQAIWRESIAGRWGKYYGTDPSYFKNQGEKELRQQHTNTSLISSLKMGMKRSQIPESCWLIMTSLLMEWLQAFPGACLSYDSNLSGAALPLIFFVGKWFPNLLQTKETSLLLQKADVKVLGWQGALITKQEIDQTGALKQTKQAHGYPSPCGKIRSLHSRTKHIYAYTSYCVTWYQAQNQQEII